MAVAIKKIVSFLGVPLQLNDPGLVALSSPPSHNLCFLLLHSLKGDALISVGNKALETLLCVARNMTFTKATCLTLRIRRKIGF